MLLPYWHTYTNSPVHDKWIELGGFSSSLGREVTSVSQGTDGVSYFKHFKSGSIYWHPDSGAREISRLTVRYGTETADLSIAQLHVVVANLSLSKVHMKKPGTWDKIVSSDPIGQDPGERPNFVGKEGWQILEILSERLKQRYEQRFDTPPPGPNLPPSPAPAESPDGRERGRSFEDLDRGNYEAEKYDRESKTA